MVQYPVALLKLDMMPVNLPQLIRAGNALCDIDQSYIIQNDNANEEI